MPGEMLVIDAHRHAGMGQLMLGPDTTRADVDLTLRHMSECAIDRSILCAITNPDYAKANREIAEICRRNPQKFIGFARHDPPNQAAALALRREVRESGLMGLKITRQPTRELLEAAELKVPLLYAPELLGDVHMIAHEYPQVPVVIAGLGDGSKDFARHYEAISIARRYPNVFLTTSALVAYQYLDIAVSELGAAKLIFASDGPERDSRVERQRVRLLKLSRADEEQVLGRTLR
jgi:uncharacterized protein